MTVYLANQIEAYCPKLLPPMNILVAVGKVHVMVKGTVGKKLKCCLYK